MKYLLCLFLTWYSVSVLAVKNYLYTGSNDLEKIESLIKRSDIEGVQIVYNWKMLEPAEGKYNFAQIEKDLKYLNRFRKKLFIQIQDRFFKPTARYIPDYLLNEPQYHGGLVRQIDNPGENQPLAQGWVTQQWHPNVRQRFQYLIAALGKQFDGRIVGINLPETAIDIDQQHDKTGFTCEKYFNATIENIRFTKQVFKKSYVVQYVNFWPCEWNNDHNYMARLFALAEKEKFGLGGPDIVPFKQAQMKNSYPLFHQYKGKLAVVAMAIQEPTLTYKNPETKHPFTRKEFVEFAENYLGVDIIFWSVTVPWLN